MLYVWRYIATYDKVLYVISIYLNINPILLFEYTFGINRTLGKAIKCSPCSLSYSISIFSIISIKNDFFSQRAYYTFLQEHSIHFSYIDIIKWFFRFNNIFLFQYVTIKTHIYDTIINFFLIMIRYLGN